MAILMVDLIAAWKSIVDIDFSALRFSHAIFRERDRQIVGDIERQTDSERY